MPRTKQNTDATKSKKHTSATATYKGVSASASKPITAKNSKGNNVKDSKPSITDTDINKAKKEQTFKRLRAARIADYRERIATTKIINNITEIDNELRDIT